MPTSYKLLAAAAVIVQVFAVGCQAAETPPARKVEVYKKWPFDATEARRRQQETAKALNLPIEKTVDLGDGVKLDLVLIPAGAFVMGSPTTEKGRLRNETQHRVRITKPFYMGKYEVTQEVWEKVMGKNPSNFRGAKLPVESVNWYYAGDFVSKLSRLVREKRRFQLPTEAQWEYACRAGSAGRFCFGDDEKKLGDYAWYRANSERKTHQVGGKKPNAWGLYDMHGNVMEWCRDMYGRYDTRVVDDPTGPTNMKDRVARDGMCMSEPADMRSGLRLSYAGVQQLSGVSGFRVALPVVLPKKSERPDKRP